MESDLDKPLWAVCVPERIIATELTYNQAVATVNANLVLPGIAIITAEAAARQEENMNGHNTDTGQCEQLSADGHY